MNKKIIFTSGGTGGHLFPAVNLMKYFSKKEYKVLLVTDIRGKNLLKESTQPVVNSQRKAHPSPPHPRLRSQQPAPTAIQSSNSKRN